MLEAFGNTLLSLEELLNSHIGRSGIALVCVVSFVVLLWCRVRRTKSSSPKDNEHLLEEVGRQYYVDSKFGFLEPSPVKRLPAGYEEWEALVERLPELNATGKLAEAVRGLPPKDFEFSERRVQQRAHVILSMLIQCFVNGPSVPWDKASPAALLELKSNGVSLETIKENCGSKRQKPKVVPAVLARPFVVTTRALGFKHCICCSAPMDTWNWTLVDESKPLTMDNVKLISRMTREPTERGFHVIPCMMQARIGPVILPLFVMDELVKSKHAEVVIDVLKALTEALQDFRQIFAQVKELVDVDAFYDIYRPLLAGFFPDGIVFEGVPSKGSSNGDEQYYVAKGKGPSAGQSTMFVLLDIALGIKHGKESGPFQDEMMEYMPGSHREFCEKFREKIGKSGHILSLVQSYARAKGGARFKTFKELQSSYRACVDAYHAFRRFHLGVATKYLVRTTTGTGNSDFRSMLREAMDDTRFALEQAQKVPSSQQHAKAE